jgi:RNA polymerase sigma-70 factor (ECF subfamily)
METGDNPATSPTLLDQLGDLNNHRAWGTFVERYKPLIERWCRQWGLQPADAEDVSARILAKLTESMTTFRYDPAHRFRGWLKTVTDNAVRSFWRDLKRRPGVLGSGDTDVQKTLEQVETPAAVEGLARELEETMGNDLERASEVTARVRARLQPHTWQAYWLTAMEGESPKEVAAKLGISTAQVYVARNRVNKMLRAEGLKTTSDDSDEREERP